MPGTPAATLSPGGGSGIPSQSHAPSLRHRSAAAGSCTRQVSACVRACVRSSEKSEALLLSQCQPCVLSQKASSVIQDNHNMGAPCPCAPFSPSGPLSTLPRLTGRQHTGPQGRDRRTLPRPSSFPMGAAGGGRSRRRALPGVGERSGYLFPGSLPEQRLGPGCLPLQRVQPFQAALCSTPRGCLPAGPLPLRLWVSPLFPEPCAPHCPLLVSLNPVCTYICKSSLY